MGFARATGAAYFALLFLRAFWVAAACGSVGLFAHSVAQDWLHVGVAVGLTLLGAIAFVDSVDQETEGVIERPRPEPIEPPLVFQRPSMENWTAFLRREIAAEIECTPETRRDILRLRTLARVLQEAAEFDLAEGDEARRRAARCLRYLCEDAGLLIPAEIERGRAGASLMAL